MKLKPFTTETQRHRENLTTQQTMLGRVQGNYLCSFKSSKLSFFPLPFSVSLCLCGEIVCVVQL
jgi:hypothetical protein